MPCCWLFSITLPAQPVPTAAALSTEQGLSFRNVTAIGQDGQGLMWFGTQLGLNRYDGYRFTQFSGNAQAGRFFPGDEILDNSLVFVNDTIFWVVADGLLYAVNTADFSVEHLSAEAGINGQIWQLRRAANGTIWLVWDTGEEQHLCYTANGSDFVEVAAVPRLRREFTSLAIDTSGNAWWSTSTCGLQHYTQDGRLLSEVKLDSFVWYGTTMFFTPLMVDSRNRLFVLPKSTRQIWQYFPEERRTQVIARDMPGLAYYALEDRQGNLWFATKTGLMRWDTEGRWADYSAVLHKALQFSNIHDLFEDRTHLLWVATDNGLVRMPIQPHLFQNYLMQPGVAWGNTTRGMFEDTSGRMYVYCEGGQLGLHRIYPKSGVSSLLNIGGIERPDSLLLDQAKHFVYDPAENAAWALTDRLIKIDLSELRSTTVKGIPVLDGKFSPNPFILLKNGDFLLGNTLEQLAIYHRQTETLRPFSPAIPSKVKSAATEYFLENEDGSIWVATASEGLFRFSGKGKLLQQFSTQSIPALSNNHLLVLHADAQGLVWIGTFGGGLNCFDPATKTIRIFTKKEGLSDDNVTGILSDANGNIWASTYNGLSCYRKADGTFQSFYEEDGLSSNEFNYTSFFKDKEGKLWFGGMNGVNVFRPENFLEQKLNPPLCFTNFSKYSRRTDSLETWLPGSRESEVIEIAPYDSYFQIDWALPNYFKPEKNRFYVWLEGLDDGWYFLGNTPSIRYNQLPDGHYILHVKGSDSKGNWSEKELAIPIWVRPFFYQTWWFVLACATLAAGIAYAVARYRLQHLLEMERLRTRIASDLHDEIGSMLSGLAMQAEILELSKAPHDVSRLRHISQISRQAVAKMRDIVWSIDSRRDFLKNLLDRMREHTEEVLAPRNIAVLFQAGELPPEKKLAVDVRQQLFYIFKEALTNIARHSGATGVTIRFGNSGHHFELYIHDNGCASAPKKPSTGLGLANMKMRAEKLGASLEVAHDDGFSVLLRMKKL